MTHFRTTYLMPLACLAIVFLTACKSPTITEPKRSGIEQLLLSNAVDTAIAKQRIEQVDDQKVFVSEDYLESYDSRYVAGSIRALMSENGAHLVNTREEADIIVEARSGALGIDSSSTILGLPSIPVVIPGAGSISLPDIALYKSAKADSIAKLSLLAYKRTGEPVFSSAPYSGESHFHHYTFLFFLDINFTDIPERKRF